MKPRSLAEEVREEFLRIRKRFEGRDLASIRVSAVEKIEAYVTDLEARVSAQPPEPGTFDVVKQVQQSDARGDIRNEFARRAVERDSETFGAVL